MIQLRPCPKSYTADQDKATTPAETVRRVRERLASLDTTILSQTRRVDVGRLGIPVFLSMCGDDAKSVMPTRKQMGKGASLEQAEASALMELAERYSFFSFWRDEARFLPATWTEAQAEYGDALVPLSVILQSVGEGLREASLRSGSSDVRRSASGQVRRACLAGGRAAAHRHRSRGRRAAVDRWRARVRRSPRARARAPR